MSYHEPRPLRLIVAYEADALIGKFGSEAYSEACWRLQPKVRKAVKARPGQATCQSPSGSRSQTQRPRNLSPCSPK
jgi:hypothetical protein